MVDITIDWDDNANNGTIMPDAWGSGTIINPDAGYLGTSCWEMTSGNGWGMTAAVLAMMGDLYNGNQLAAFPVDVSTYNSLELTLATSGGFDDLKVKLAGPEKVDFKGYISIEYEGDPENPVPSIKECVQEIKRF